MTRTEAIDGGSGQARRFGEVVAAPLKFPAGKGETGEQFRRGAGHGFMGHSCRIAEHGGIRKRWDWSALEGMLWLVGLSEICRV